MNKSRTYSELCRLETFEERFEYLSLGAQVGAETFGFDRWMNQEFYSSREWRMTRREVILRDMGCDLGVRGHEILFGPLVHHMNPITSDDISHGGTLIIDPEFLITTRHRTHNAIHYGDARLLARPHVERAPGDTALWSPIQTKRSSR